MVRIIYVILLGACVGFKLGFFVGADRSLKPGVLYQLVMNKNVVIIASTKLILNRKNKWLPFRMIHCTTVNIISTYHTVEYLGSLKNLGKYVILFPNSNKIL